MQQPAAHSAEFSISVVYDFVVVAHHSVTTAHHTLILLWVVWAGHTAIYIYHVIVLIIDTFLLSNDFKHLRGKKGCSHQNTATNINLLQTEMMRKLFYMSVNLFT